MKNSALEPGRLCNMVMDRGHTFMSIWRKGEEKASESSRRKREAEEADKFTTAALGVTAGQLRCFNRFGTAGFQVLY